MGAKPALGELVPEPKILRQHTILLQLLTEIGVVRWSVPQSRRSEMSYETNATALIF
jgi:hypothetical protein